jgi:hypothetical protein
VTSADDKRPGCADCGGPLVIVRSVVRNNGRHRFMRCKFCGYRHRDLIAPPAAPVLGPADPSCERCREWRGERCSLGFPDPIEEGPGFARDCNLYVVEG